MKEKAVCKNCGKEFYFFKSRKTKHGCCSRKCKEIQNKKQLKMKYRHICDNCGEVFYRRANGKIYTFCSQECSKEYMVGENSPFYKNGCIMLKNGYKVILVSKKKYEYEHRVLMEKHLNRKLNKNEIVHHIDGNKSNNSIKNLKILDKKEHDRLHTTERHKQERLFKKR